jgi:SOS-response transcriptional repressor LexA
MGSTGLAATHAGEYLLIEAAPPGEPRSVVGVLLIDREMNRLHLRFRRDWEELFTDPENVEYFSAVEDDLEARGATLGAADLVREMEDSLSNAVLVTDRERVLVEDWDKALARLYRRHVQAKVLPFRTHLPMYSVQAAAGSFGEPGEAEAEGWVETPRDLRLQPDMFVAHVTGRSMLPRIQPDSLCVFRGGEALAGSRSGKLVLVENYGEPGEHRYTIKRYESVRRAAGDDSWEHEKIILHPLNPEFEAWELTPGRIEVRGIFVRVLE